MSLSICARASPNLLVSRPELTIAGDWKGAGMPPTLRNGKICYIEIPAIDVARSADFYASVFGWKIRRRGDGATAFDDGVGEVSGAILTAQP